jgi:tetratricopeptide (TPR) repeat protein
MTLLITGCDRNKPKTQYVWFPKGVEMKNNESYHNANVAMQQRQGQEALQYLQQSAQEGYRHPFIFLRLASHHASLQNFEEAKEYSLQAIDILESDDIKVMFPNELEMFKKDKRAKTNASAYSLHAAILFKLQQYEQASSYVQKAIDLNSDDASARETAGKLAIRNGDYKKAITIFREFIATSPRFYSAHFYLGKSLVLSGNTIDGVSSLETFLANAPPQDDHISEAKELIEEYK